MSSINPKLSGLNFRPSVNRIFKKQQEDITRVKRQRDELLDVLSGLTESPQKTEPNPIFNTQINTKIITISRKMMDHDELNTLFKFAKKWDSPLLNNLIGVQIVPKTENQFVILGMSNELKMIFALLFENANFQDYTKTLKYHFSPHGIKMFDKISQLRQFQFLIHEMNFGLRQFHLPKLMQSQILREQELKKISQLPLIQMNKTIILMLSERVKRIREERNQLKEKIAVLQAQKEKQRGKATQAEQANTKLADELFLLKNNKNKSIESEPSQYKQTIASMQIQRNRLIAQNKKLIEGSKKQKETAASKINDLKYRNQNLLKQNKILMDQMQKKQRAIQQRLQFEQSIKIQKQAAEVNIKEFNELKLAFDNLKRQKKQKQMDDWVKNLTIQENKQMIAELQSKLKDIENKHKEEIKTISQNLLKSQTLLNQKDEMIKRQQAQLSKLAKDLEITNELKERQSKKLKSKDEQIEQIQSQYDAVTKILQERDELQKFHAENRATQVQRNYKQLERGNTQLSNAHKQLETAYRELQRKCRQLQRKQIQLQRVYKQLEGTNKDLQKALLAKNSMLEAKQAQLHQLKRNSFQRKSSNNYKELNDNIKKIQENNAKLMAQNNRMKKTNGNSSLLRMNTLFQNDILDNYPQHKQFLAETIQNHMRMTIIKTRRIYAYDPHNRVNFHKYIDGVQNIVVIVKLINGTFVAGYSQGPFQQNRIQNRQGLIIALSKRKYFTLINNTKRAISYDDYYIIFGNSQLRIRSQENILFSNFGISNSYYANKNERVNVILGGGPQEREVQLEHYQIYQLIFDV